MAAKIFISYSHRDEEYKDDLQIGLATLKNNGHIAAWDDRALTAGEEWDHEISEALTNADIIILLVSPNFLASRYVKEKEIAVAMQRHEDPNDPAVVVPVIIRPCDWKDNAFSRLQALPKNSKPVSTWSNRDEAMLDVVNGIKKLVLRKPKTANLVADHQAYTPPPVIATEPAGTLSLSELRNQVAAGKSDRVIKQLLDHDSVDEDIKNQLIMLSARLTSLKKNQTMGVVSGSDANRTEAQINYGLLQILGDLA